MGLLIILMVMEQNGMYVPGWAMGAAWSLLVVSVLNMILQIILDGLNKEYERK